MALADTARLLASLELQDKFSGTAGNAERHLGRLEGALSRGRRQAGVFSGAVSTALGVGLERAVRGGVTLITNAISGGVASLNELESVNTATNTVIASTKGVAGQSAEGIRALAEEYENLNATMDDKVIQSGANLLLTFTKIRDDAFEPALEAALNMNEAMGGGPEGLQSTIIQVGKALNDPVKGVSALRRVGVQLTQQQEDQIKTLVEQNDLYGAQRIILDELTTQFGGRYAAAGATAEGRQAAFNDRLEDLQKRLAGPLLPAIDRTREKIIEMLGSPRALNAAGRLGEAIAGIFTDRNLDRVGGVLEGVLGKLEDFDWSKVGSGVSQVFGFLGSLPWGTIGEGLKITGQAAKIAVDAFLALPKEVQGIAVAALAVNKLTGGLAGGLAGSLIGKGVGAGIGALRGSTPATPLFTKEVGLPGTGGGGTPVAPGGGGTAGRVAGGLAIGLGVAAVGVAAVEVINFENMRNESRAGLQGILDELPRNRESLDKIQGQIDQDRPFLEGILFNTNVRPQLEQAAADIRAEIAASSSTASSIANSWNSEQRSAYANLNQHVSTLDANEGSRAAAALARQDLTAAAVRATQGPLATIAAKDFNPEVNVHARFQATISIHDQKRVELSAIRSHSDTGFV
jgi:hypothetical protein